MSADLRRKCGELSELLYRACCERDDMRALIEDIVKAAEGGLIDVPEGTVSIWKKRLSYAGVPAEEIEETEGGWPDWL